MGLSQQVAYSSLLAFFPAMISLIAFLDLIGAYGALLDFLDPIAPKSVTSIIHQLERDTGNASVVLVALGIFGALWAGSGAMSSVVKAVNRAYDTGGDAPALEGATDLPRAACSPPQPSSPETCS